MQEMQLYLKHLSCTKTGENFYKIGVTKHENTNKRFSYGAVKVADSDLPIDKKIKKLLNSEKYISDFPYDISHIHQVEYTYLGDALIAERDILASVKKYTPRRYFSGCTECFLGDDSVIERIVEYMNTNSKEINFAAPDELTYVVKSMFIKEKDPISKHLAVMKKCRE